MRKHKTVCAATLLALTCAARPAAAEIVLVREGQPKAVVVAFTNSPACRDAAGELQRYLTKMSAATLPVGKSAVADKQTTALLVGLAGDLSADLAKRQSVSRLKPEGFWILAEESRVAGPRVVIAGRDEPGLWFGVYEFLESLGCRWYFPGELGENVPKKPTIVVKSRDEVQNPDFLKRSMWWGYGNRPGWQVGLRNGWSRRNKMGGVSVGMGHSLYRIISPREFGKTHPEYFPLRNGRRQVPEIGRKGDWQPCTSHPKVIEIAAAKAIGFFDKRLGAYAFSLSPNDGYGWCECDRCTAQDPPQLRGAPERGKARRMTLFANAVAERLVRRHPDKYVCWYAYMATVEPPADVKVHPNVVIALAHYSPFCDPIHALQDPRSKANRGFVRLVNGWNARTDKLFIREYWTMANGLACICPAYSLAEDIPFLKTKGVIGFSSESLSHYGGSALNFWLAGRKMWNAEADTEQLLRDFYEGMYGPAAPAMRRYFETILKLGRERGRGVSFREEEFRRLGTMLDEAARASRTGKQRARVRMTREYYDYTKQVRDYKWAPTAAKSQAIKSLVERLAGRRSLAIDFVQHRASFKGKLHLTDTAALSYCGAAVKPYTSAPMPPSAAKQAFTVRGRHTFVVLLRAGEDLRGHVEVQPLGSYITPTRFRVLGPDRQKLFEGAAAVGNPSAFQVKAKQDGLHVITVDTNKNGARLFVQNQYFCMAGRVFSLVYAQPRAYVLGAPGSGEFRVTLTTSSPGETGSMAVRDPRGKLVGRGDTVATGRFVVKAGVARRYRGKAWSIRIQRAARGQLEDLRLEFGPGCGRFVATHPTRLLTDAE